MMTLSALLIVAIPLRVLTLSEAVRTAEDKQPQLQQALAALENVRGQVDAARAPLLPQVYGQLQYQRMTANYAPRPGALPSSVSGTAASSFDTRNYFSSGLTLSHTLWDFGSSWYTFRAAQSSAESTRETTRTTRAQVVLKVRQVYFQASGQKALVKVAREAMDNQQRHMKQIEGFVQVGTRPSIDLAQARADAANAKLQLINAENGYRTARAQLSQAMGVVQSLDYEVSDDMLGAVSGEEGSADELVRRAVAARPELSSLQQQIEAQERTIRATWANYWPTLGFSMSLTDAGSELQNLAWNWSAALNLSWPLFQGLQTRAHMRSARALASGLRAQEEGLLQQVRLEVVQAQIAIRAAKEALVAAGELLANARERLRLAEGRYATGAGNSIELGDAQSQLTSAAGQRVVANFNLATARAQLLVALGGK